MRSHCLFILLSFTLLFLCCSFCTELSAQEGEAGTIELRCPKEPANLQLFVKVLTAKLKMDLDTEAYSKAKVKVKLRLVGRDRGVRHYNFDELLDGITVIQEGITTTIEGLYAYNEACLYSYVARIQFTARDKASGAILRSVTDSVFQISSSGTFEIKRLNLPPTPTPKATATAGPRPTATPDDGDDGGSDDPDDDPPADDPEVRFTPLN